MNYKHVCTSDCLCRYVARVVESRTFLLDEELAELLATLTLEKFRRIDEDA